ncbi:autotransporter outer membrane beta-barrel domain-containing protein [Shewanella schlegeliana]|uniref:Autotransporter outer membrane beta-barrel domain-containing protein n=2 Tax=Shewanella schlegeliana TaxID=190308 RepID=A0ABS1SZU9_9GAMM|nr:autotransporter outer membrane beta-barrel domain-containing protein [Shewanella schlegeliana]
MSNLAIISLLVAPSAIAKSESKPSYRPSPLSVSVSRIMTGTASVGDEGNELQREQWMFDAKGSLALNRQWSIGAGVGYDNLDYDWRSPSPKATLKDGTKTWDKIERYRASLSISYRPNKNWMFILAPKLQYAYADTASSSNAQSYGAVFSGMYRFDSGNMLGFGAAYLNDIDEVRTVPFIAVNWQLTEKLSLGNPFSAGFSGPAGLELSYQLSPDWNMGIGTSKRTNRFLIADDELTAEIEEWVAFTRVGWDISQSVSLSAYGGYFFNGELELNPQHCKEAIDNQGAAALDVTVRF